MDLGDRLGKSHLQLLHVTVDCAGRSQMERRSRVLKCSWPGRKRFLLVGGAWEYLAADLEFGVGPNLDVCA